MPNLNTNCTNCCFYICRQNKEDPRVCDCKCKIGIPINKNITDGFCRFKRQDGYFQKEVPTEYWLKAIHQEDSQISLVITYLNKNLSNLIMVISAAQSERHIGQLIVLMPNNNDIKQIMQTTSKLSKPWKVDYLKDENVSPLNAMTYASRLVEYNWFYPITDNELINHKFLEKAMAQVQSNNGCFASVTDGKNSLINIHAFKEMDANNEMSWFDKVKTFDNKEQVCQILE